MHRVSAFFNTSLTKAFCTRVLQLNALLETGRCAREYSTRSVFFCNHNECARNESVVVRVIGRVCGVLAE
jgi:hypothetical protein